MPPDLNCAEVDGANRQLGTIQALDLSGHSIAVGELDDFIAHAVGRQNAQASENSRQDDGRCAMISIPDNTILAHHSPKRLETVCEEGANAPAKSRRDADKRGPRGRRAPVVAALGHVDERHMIDPQMA